MIPRGPPATCSVPAPGFTFFTELSMTSTFPDRSVVSGGGLGYLGAGWVAGESRGVGVWAAAGRAPSASPRAIDVARCALRDTRVSMVPVLLCSREFDRASCAGGRYPLREQR